MGMDDRIRYVVREEISRALAAPDTADQLRDLHTELHVLATRVSTLEQKLTETAPQTETVPAVSRTRTARKAPDDQKGSA